MNKIYALTLASMLVAPAAVFADSHIGNPGYGNQGCTVQHPDGQGGTVQIDAKNPGDLFREGREAHNPKQAANAARFETVGALIDAVCGTPD